MIGAWRKELWHPFVVHFPIALLLIATLFLLISFFNRGEYERLFSKASYVLQLIGVVVVWLAIYTGDMADGIVGRKLCDPTVLKDHELAAETTAYLFTAAVVIHTMLSLNLFRSRLRKISPYVIFACMIIGSVFLVRAGHLGASVVYEQGAGVFNHAADCDDFR